MKQYNVSLVIEVPETGATEREIEEWIEYKTGYRHDISAGNPLADCDMDANWIEIDHH
jgi:hypothetical protein